MAVIEECTHGMIFVRRCTTIINQLVFTVRNEVANVMFLHVYVSHSVHTPKGEVEGDLALGGV